MIIGIDLGTTNSAVGVWRNGAAELIPNSLGDVLTPSAVSLDEGTGEVIVGLAARERQSTHPQVTATAFKRYMGSARRTRLGTRDFLPEELSALVLGRLKADAEAYLGHPVTEAVITVPAYFNDKQRKATRRAGEMAGLKVERLLNEPTAAALAYGIHELGDETRFLVFDLGGGTFDVSILEIFEGIIEVRASTGDNRLGGEDFNAVLIHAFTQATGLSCSEPHLVERIRAAAERARRTLSDQAEATMSVTWKDQAHPHTISAEDFETQAAALLARLREPVLRSLRDSGIRADDLKEIVLVGGATRMPLVRKAVTKMFGRFPSHAVNPDEAVARGAAIQAGLKSRDEALKEVVLTDVCPYSMGVEVSERLPTGSVRDGVFSPVIERNTVIPASRASVYSTAADNQRQVNLRIYQGESLDVSDNVYLGELAIPVPPGKAGQVPLEVRFTYDINGLLEVDVHVPTTGARYDLVIMDEDGVSEAEVKQRRAALEKLKQHPRDADANRAAIARAARCYEDFLGDTRAYVAGLVHQFESVLERQDPREVDQARKALLTALDALEGQTWL